MELSDIAREAGDWFETARRATGDTDTGPREDGESYVRTKDGAPEWVRDMVYAAHGHMLPDDWRYACIRNAVEWIADGNGDEAGDFADSEVDVYTADRIAWLATGRASYCDEAQSEGLAEGSDIVSLLGLGQYMEASEVFGLVLSALREELDSREDEDEDEDEDN